MNRGVIFLAIAVVIGGFIVQSRVKKHNEETVNQIERIERGATAWDEQKVAQAATEAAAKFQEARGILREKGPRAAFYPFREGRDQLIPLVDLRSDKQVSDGQTAEQFLHAHAEAFAGVLIPELEAIAADLEQGRGWPDDLKQLATDYDYYGVPGVKDWYQERCESVEAVRAAAARRWVRVEIVGDTRKYRDRLEKCFRDNWRPVGDRQLVFGYAMSGAERQATWKSIDVACQATTAIYTDANPGRRRHGQYLETPSIPERLTIKFKVNGRSPVPTTWDALETIDIDNEVPRTVTMRIGNNGTYDEAARLEEQYDRQLMERLEKALTKLPAFGVYPGVDPSSLHAVDGGRIDRKAAGALALIDPRRLERELAKAIVSQDPAVQAEAIASIVELDLKNFAPWVIETVSRLDGHNLQTAVKAFENNGGYGDYKPLIAVLADPDSDAASYVMRALQGRLGNTEARQAISRRLSGTRARDRANYIYLYVQEAPIEEIAAGAAGWLHDEDEDFAGVSFAAINRRDKALAEKLTVEHFAGAGERVQEAMLKLFSFDPERHGEAELAIIRAGATNSESRQVKSAAYDRIWNDARTPGMQRLMSALVEQEQDPRYKEQLQKRLAQTR